MNDRTQTITCPECAPWCAYQDEATCREFDPGVCLGVELRTPLSIPQSNPDDLPPGVADFITVYLAREPGRPDAIVVQHGDLVGIELTATEAREVVEHLQLVLDQIGAIAVTSVAHGVTVETVHLPAGIPLRASCLCGWASPIVASRPQAVAAGEEHVADVSRPQHRQD